MRRLAPLALLVAIACGPSEAESAEARARGALERDGFDAITLHAVEGAPGEYDFEATREGRSCDGTVIVRGAAGRRTAAISSRCP